MIKRYLLLAVLLVLMIALIGVAPLLARDNKVMNYTCPANTTCHILLEEGSETYLLTANGHAVIEVNGHDSLLIQNEQ